MHQSTNRPDPHASHSRHPVARRRLRRRVREPCQTRVQESTTPVTARTLVRTAHLPVHRRRALRGHGVLDRPDPGLAAVERVDPADDRDALGPVQVVLDDAPSWSDSTSYPVTSGRTLPVVDTMPHHTMTPDGGEAAEGADDPPAGGAGRGAGQRHTGPSSGWSARQVRGWTASILGHARDHRTEGSLTCPTGSGSCASTRTRTTSPARAPRPWRGTSTRATRCSSSRAPAVSAATCSTPGSRTTPTSCATSPRCAATRWPRRRRSSACSTPGSGFVDSGLPEGDPLPPLPDGLLRARAAGGHDRGAGPRDPAVPPARRHDVRRERRLPAPRPRHVPRRVDGGVRRGRRPRRRFPHAGPPWQPLKVYYNQTFSRARIEAFHEALTALGEESPYAEWLENWSRPDRAVTTRVRVRRLVRAAGRRPARPRHPGRPRRHVVPRPARGAGARSGRPRTSRRPLSFVPDRRGRGRPVRRPARRRRGGRRPRHLGRPQRRPRHPHGA